MTTHDVRGTAAGDHASGSVAPEAHGTADGDGCSKKPRRRRPRWCLRILVAIAAVLALGGVALFCAVQHRLEQERMGLGAVSAPTAPRRLEGASARTGAFTAQIDFTTMATGAKTVSTEAAWDDEWFFQDPTVYNHDLATTCAVLSAVANSESGYYQAGSGGRAYMEDALAALGFEDISTASYQYRSEIFDEIVDALTGTDDVVAYSVATKHLVAADGREKTLFLVSVRGSYGAEWLSDLNMNFTDGYENIEHEGFMRSANEIVDDLAERITAEAELEGTDDIALLFCGHSRGAATANIACAYADQMTLGLRPFAPLESIYCYTFATPETTLFEGVDDPLFDNIFNILNPSDMVPRMPLAAWGYARYGRDLMLPGYGDEGFDEAHEAMGAVFEAMCGVESPYVPDDRERVDWLMEDLAQQVPTVEDLFSLGGAASLARDLVADINPLQVLYSHYPSVYIAWMQSLDTLL